MTDYFSTELLELEQLGFEKAHLEALYRSDKTVRAEIFLDAEGRTIEEKKASVEINPKVIEMRDLINDATLEYETIKLKRSTREVYINAWQTASANRRQGNV